MILCTGIGSTIVQAVKELRPQERIERIGRRSQEVYDFSDAEPGLRIILAGGYLAGKSDAEHTADTSLETLNANYLQPMNIADQALGEIPDVRICIIGSQSAVAGSYDTQYAMAKAMLHRWVLRQNRRTSATQQLVVVAPPIIADSAMTLRRHDYPQVLLDRPHCTAMDVAKLVVEVLYAEEIQPGVNSCTIRYLNATRNPGAAPT